jgi:hypothetical protein
MDTCVIANRPMWGTYMILFKIGRFALAKSNSLYAPVFGFAFIEYKQVER